MISDRRQSLRANDSNQPDRRSRIRCATASNKICWLVLPRYRKGIRRLRPARIEKERSAWVFGSAKSRIFLRKYFFRSGKISAFAAETAFHSPAVRRAAFAEIPQADVRRQKCLLLLDFRDSLPPEAGRKRR